LKIIKKYSIIYIENKKKGKISMAYLVAKSYTSWAQIGEPFAQNKRQYIKVARPNSSEIKTVRVYSPTEYARLYPQTKVKEEDELLSQKKALGFSPSNFITLFPHTSINDQTLRSSPARYCVWWGWYLPGHESIPPTLAQYPTVHLPWESASRKIKKGS
jgi:hypothetical protein